MYVHEKKIVRTSKQVYFYFDNDKNICFLLRTVG